MLGSVAFRFVLVKPSKRPVLDCLRSPLPLRGGLAPWAEVVDDSDDVESCLSFTSVEGLLPGSVWIAPPLTQTLSCS